MWRKCTVTNKQFQMLMPELFIDMGPVSFDFQAINISYGNEAFQFHK